MPIDFNLDFLTSSTRSSALSLTSSTGLTINNQVIGGFHAYHSLNNIINGSEDNKIPPIFTQGGTTSQPRTLPGCNDSARCLASQNAIVDGLASAIGEDITDLIEGELGLPSGTLCSSDDGEIIGIKNDYCQYTGSIDITNPSSLELNSDLLSSGRLQLGMVVYISEKSQSYQFIIDDYETLYNAAETSGDIITTTFTTAVGDGGAGGAAFINAWTVHKVEGELKNPSDPDQGTWSRDEANWKKYPNVPEYFTINAVPASEEVDDFNFEDAYIVVPQEWDGKKVVSVEASLFTMDSSNFTNDAGIQLFQISKDADKTGYTYVHAFGQKSHSSNFTSALTLSANSTLQLKKHGSFGSGNQGYTATFKVIS